jgi:hypothetical protein
MCSTRAGLQRRRTDAAPTLLEVGRGTDSDWCHQPQGRRIPPHLVQFRHVVEVHPVDACHCGAGPVTIRGSVPLNALGAPDY